jgi:DNA invertase Pin-like site-specific DNA recombinase
MSRPSQITESHVRRRVILYLRQSSEEQVRNNIGSTALQRDLKNQLEEWGWSPDLITVIDSDLGASGSRPGQRAGFADLLAQIESGAVGMVAVTDISRLGRNLQDISDFAAQANGMTSFSPTGRRSSTSRIRTPSSLVLSKP